jgi:NADP-dependent 3-hydroxy acid dehydrogenase YdfG
LPQMLEAGKGTVINVSSGAAHRRSKAGVLIVPPRLDSPC